MQYILNTHYTVCMNNPLQISCTANTSPNLLLNNGLHVTGATLLETKQQSVHYVTESTTLKQLLCTTRSPNPVTDFTASGDSCESPLKKLLLTPRCSTDLQVQYNQCNQETGTTYMGLPVLQAADVSSTLDD